jgi:hypothetical protein
VPASAARRGTMSVSGLKIQRADTVGEAMELVFGGE